MDDNGGLGMRHWGGYYEQPQVKGGLSLQLMSAGEQNLKHFVPNGAFIHRDCNVPEPSGPMDYLRESWMYHHRDNNNNKMLHVLPMNPNYAIPLDAHPAGNPHTLQMLETLEPATKDEKAPAANEPGGVRKDAPPKKRSRGTNPQKLPKPKKPKKAPVPKEDVANKDKSSALHAKGAKRSMDVVINGIGLDISRLPTPVCSCTGAPQPCYRWGVGGWQSACCTTSMSVYPLPMSTKRRGTRIPGRKMSQGAFKKVLEKLAGEGYNLSNPIDLKTYWAKHGTNKFVTIRSQWKSLFGAGDVDFIERESWEERETLACVDASEESCIRFAKEKCLPQFRDARISLTGLNGSPHSLCSQACDSGPEGDQDLKREHNNPSITVNSSVHSNSLGSN